MAKKIKRYKVGLESETFAISMVTSPAIEEEFMAFNEDEAIKIEMSDDDKRIVCGAVLVPNKDIYRRSDKGEFYLSFSAEAIEKMALDYMTEYRQKNVSLQHEDAVDNVCVFETWLKSDMLYDKSVAIGLNKDLPIGTWFVSMKVNDDETWERVKSGELRGFSVESMIKLEDFTKTEEDDDMKLMAKIKEALVSMFGKKDNVEPIDITDMEAQTTTETVTETPTQTVEETPTAIETPTETPATTEAETPTEEPKTEQPTEEAKDNHVEELIKNLTDEIKALKELNSELTTKVNDLSKRPSTRRVNTTPSNGNNGNTFDAWRETMRGLIG